MPQHGHCEANESCRKDDLYNVLCGPDDGDAGRGSHATASEPLRVAVVRVTSLPPAHQRHRVEMLTITLRSSLSILMPAAIHASGGRTTVKPTEEACYIAALRSAAPPSQ